MLLSLVTNLILLNFKWFFRKHKSDLDTKQNLKLNFQSWAPYILLLIREWSYLSSYTQLYWIFGINCFLHKNYYSNANATRRDDSVSISNLEIKTKHKVFYNWGSYTIGYIKSRRHLTYSLTEKWCKWQSTASTVVSVSPTRLWNMSIQM